MADELDELNEDSTPEDAAAYAEQVVKEVEADRAGEQKSDAQITSEQAGKPANDKETPAETISGSDDTVSDDEETGVESKDYKEWFDDSAKAEAAALGIDESDVSDFANREEFDKALKLFEKKDLASSLEAGRKALAEGGEGEVEEKTGRVRGEGGRFTPKEEKEETPTEPEQREGQYEFKTDIYDEDLESDLKGFRDHYETRLAKMEELLQASHERFAEADQVAKERHFDNLVDTLGHADLFGKTDKESDKERQRRNDLFVEAETYLRGRELLGRPAELNETILNRVARSLFAEELGKKELKKRTRKISKQSDGRQGGGATRPQDPREDPRDEADRMYRELERV